MALVEVIGLSVANLATLFDRIKTDMTAAGWTKVDENTKSGSCPYTAVDTTNNTFTIAGHGFVDGELFQIYSSGTVPSPLTNWNPYYIRDATTDTFKLCSTQGGTALDLTTQGTGTHYFREYMHAWSGTGEASNRRISYVQFVRAAVTSLYVYGCYGFNASTHLAIGRGSANAFTTSDTGMYYYFWGNKDFVNIAVKSGTTWTTIGFGWPVDYYGDQTTLTQAETSGLTKTLHVADSSIFKPGKIYQIYSLEGEGRDALTVNSITNGTEIIVANLPRNYASGSLIGNFTNSFGVLLASGNSWNWKAVNPMAAVGTADSSASFGAANPIPSTSADPCQRGDQKYILQPVLVGESDAFTGWLAPEHMLWIPYTSVAAEDTAGVTERDSGTASSGTATTLVDGSKNWTPDAHIGKCVIIKTGQGAGQIRKITDNEATSLTVAAWTTQPNNTSTYVIVDEAYRCFPASPPAYAIREGR
jgi:hypothetical protein